MNTKIEVMNAIVKEVDTIKSIVNTIGLNSDFILTGSRSFGMATNKSDTDFFVSDSVYMSNYRFELMDLGFRLLPVYDLGEENDPSLLGVLRYISPSLGIQIDIQVIKDFSFPFKVDAQKKIEEACKLMPSFMRMVLKDKKLAKALWTSLIMGYCPEEIYNKVKWAQEA